jgi:LPS-assembly lipoprotein
MTKKTVFIQNLSLAIISLGLLQACGFKPTYSEKSLSSSLASLEFELPSTKLGYRIEHELTINLRPYKDRQKTHRVEVVVTDRTYSIGVRVDDTYSRAEINANVAYKLIDKATNKTLLNKGFVEVVTYNAANDPFANVMAQNHAHQRLSTAIARRLESELVHYYQTQP